MNIETTEDEPVRDSIAKVAKLIWEIEGFVLGGQALDLAPLVLATDQIHRHAVDGKDRHALNDSERTALGEAILELERMTHRLSMSLRETAAAVESNRTIADVTIEYEKFRVG